LTDDKIGGEEKGRGGREEGEGKIGVANLYFWEYIMTIRLYIYL
jgi:hypothetical protein